MKTVKIYLINMIKDKNTYLGLALSFYIADVVLKAFSFRLLSTISIMSFQWFSALIPLAFLLIYFFLGRKEELPRLKPFVIFFTCLLLAIMVSYMLNPQYRYWYFLYERGVLNVLIRPDSGVFAILFFSVFNKNEKRIMFKYLSFGIFLVFIYRILQYIKATINGYWINTGGSGTNIESGYNLEFGYTLAFVSLFFIFNASVSKQRYRKYGMYILAFGTFLLALTNGSRGALLPIAVYIILTGLQSLHRRNSRDSRSVSCVNNNLDSSKLRYCTIFLVVAVIFTTSIVAIEGAKTLKANDIIRTDTETEITNEAGQIINEDLESGRTLSMIVDKDFFQDSGRLKIYRTVWRALKDKPVLGLGIFGDRPIVSQILVFGYVHNVILEFWVNFGVILGTLFLAAYIIISFRMIFLENNKWISSLYTVFLASSMKLFLSSSFWITLHPWVCIVLYFRFSDIWEKDRQRILLAIRKIKRGKNILKTFKIAMVVLFASLLIISGANLYRYNREYRQNRVSIKKPTVILTFDNISRLDQSIMKTLNHKNISGTLFLQSGLVDTQEKYMNTSDLNTLADSGWDIQAGIAEQQSLSIMSKEELAADIELTRSFFSNNNLTTPIAFGYKEGYINFSDRDYLSEFYPLIRLKSRPIAEESYGIKYVDKETLAGMYSLNVTVTNYDPQDMEGYINKQIRAAADKSNLILLRFDSSNVSDSRCSNYYNSFMDIVADLEKQGFKFSTMSELYSEVSDLE